MEHILREILKQDPSCSIERYFEIVEHEKQYECLSEHEKDVINKTILSIEDIKHYETILSRKLSKRELTIAGLLRNNGVLLTENDFKR